MARKVAPRRKPAKKKKTQSRGPFRVGLMALHDRTFFERLLTDPRSALSQMIAQGSLSLTAADVDAVVRMIEAPPRLSTANGLAIWDQWHQTGQVTANGWPIRGWPIGL